MKIIADLCIVPMGVGSSVSRYIRELRDVIEASGLSLMSISNGFERHELAFELCKLGFGLDGTLEVA